MIPSRPPRGVHLITLGALVLALGLACGIGEPRTVRSDDGLVQVEVPFLWTDQEDLNDEADVEVSLPSSKLYLIVLSEPKGSFQGMDYHGHSQLTRDIFGIPTVAGPEQLQIKGRPAVQYRLEGTVDGNDITFLHTTIDGVDHFHQVVAWTRSSRFERSRDRLDAVIASVQETGEVALVEAAPLVADWTGARSVVGVGVPLRMQLPAGWTVDTTLHEDAVIQARDDTHGCYLVVLADAKDDLEDPSLASHSRLTRGVMEQNLPEGFVETGPEPLVIHDLPAVRYQLDSVLDQVRLTYLHTTIEGEEHLYQVLAWSQSHGFERRRSVLEAVVATAEE